MQLGMAGGKSQLPHCSKRHGPAAAILRRAFFTYTAQIVIMLFNNGNMRVKIIIVALVIGMTWSGERTSTAPEGDSPIRSTLAWVQAGKK
ncbi:hypothetical protein [Nitrosospira briensis]|uniref:hypothetical protein n=1 Tax=Nitrosospira briensis TaxID=35799 RepID=UPI0008EE644D|nr:hypothetical protein [Nitrosospira briensis]SFN76605.1 hypothetical protein SAMN05216332_101536 [Nitrosospira briensis]